MAAGPLAAACAAVPDPAHGVTAWPGVRFVVEILDQGGAGAALWNTARWGTDAWGTFSAWVDVTDRFRQLTLTRGRVAPGDRYRVAGGQLELDNLDGALDPWATTGPFTHSAQSWILPGVILRVGAVVAGAWHPWVTGGVEAWAPVVTPSGVAPMFVTVSDTFTDLAAIDDPALANPVGVGETANFRLDRLLTASAWRFGQALAASTVTCQSTVMADNRLGECYLTADSDGGSFYAVGDGSARFVPFGQDPAGQLATFADYPQGAQLPYVAIVPACDDSRILNVAHVACAGGTVATSSDSASRHTYGTRSSGNGFPRLDLIHQGDAHSQVLADDAIDRYANDVRRIDAVSLNADVDDRLPATMATLVIGGTVDIVRQVGGASTTTRLRIASLDYELTPAGPRPVFALDVTLETP